MLPLISVIKPVYNAEKCLERSIGSVLSQSYSRLELILVDDGSKDRSLKICRESEKKDSRVRVIAQQNAGPAMARNAALEIMQGDFVLFVDSDDLLSPDACQKMVDAMKKNDLVIGHYFFEFGKAISDRGLLSGNRVLGEQEFLMELIKKPGSFYYSALWNKLYRASIIRDQKLRFDPFLSWGEDFAFNMQYNLAVKSVAIIDMPVYHYVKNTSSTSIRSLIRILHSCKIKYRLYQHFKALYVKKGLYDNHRFAIWRYIFNVTVID